MWGVGKFLEGFIIAGNVDNVTIDDWSVENESRQRDNEGEKEKLIEIVNILERNNKRLMMVSAGDKAKWQTVSMTTKDHLAPSVSNVLS